MLIKRYYFFINIFAYNSQLFTLEMNRMYKKLIQKSNKNKKLCRNPNFFVQSAYQYKNQTWSNNQLKLQNHKQVTKKFNFF